MQKKFKIQARKVQFEGFDGSLLSANLEFPVEISPLQYVIVSHCFTCNKQTITTARLSRGLAQAGMAVLRFDFTGLGGSEGDFSSTHFSSMVKDLECAAGWLSKHYQPVQLMIGHSMGGTASLAASQAKSGDLSQVKKIITLASPANPDHVLHHFGPAMDELQRGNNAQIEVAGQLYPVTPQFVKDVQSYDMQQQMRACDIPIMAVRAGNDGLVGPQAAEDILQFTTAQTHLSQIDGADHLFSERQHSALMLSEILHWIS